MLETFIISIGFFVENPPSIRVSPTICKFVIGSYVPIPILFSYCFKVIPIFPKEDMVDVVIFNNLPMILLSIKDFSTHIL